MIGWMDELTFNFGFAFLPLQFEPNVNLETNIFIKF
jgi:hypothetical protein